MDSQENANTQTKDQQIVVDDQMKSTDGSVQQVPQVVKPDKPKPIYKCLVCGKSYSKKTSLFTHHKTHPSHCVHCGENRGSSVENIYEHNLKHINIRPFVCKQCGESFLRNQQFTEHEKSHLEKKDDKETQLVTKEKDNKYKCKTCQLSFTNWKLFYKHQQETGHVNEKFLCEICGSEFLSNFLLSQHIRRLHKRPDETFPCTSCPKVFASKANLDSHIKKMHQNDSKIHRCETCNNVFSSAPNLKQHIKTVHDVEREFECQTCKKPFKAKNRLTRHEKEVHMGKNGGDEVRMYNCDHCQKKYKRSWHQARHNQMKHENSNTSTATSSGGTPPTPEINGNLNLPSANNTVNTNNNNNDNVANNNNYNYQQEAMPQHTISPDLSNIAQQQSHHPAQSIIPPSPTVQHQSPQSHQNVWNNQAHNSPQPHHQTHIHYGSDMMENKNYAAPPLNNTNINNGQYVQYDQYSNKYDMHNAAAQQVSYDSWNHQQWDYNQHHHQQHMQPTMYQQTQPADWSTYYDPNQQHGMYNNSYTNYKTDYNCLNQQPPTHIQTHQSADPSMYNGNNYYYYPQDPYINQQQQQQMSSPQTDYSATSNHPQNYNPM